MYSYRKILENTAYFPEFVSKDEFCKICGICEKTGTKILKSGKIPFKKKNLRLLHYYEIAVADIIKYVDDIYKLKICEESDLEILKNYYILKFIDVPDMISSKTVQLLTGYGNESVRRWITKGFLPAVKRRERFCVSKDDLIDFMCSVKYRSIIRKSATHVEDEINIKEILTN